MTANAMRRITDDEDEDSIRKWETSIAQSYVFSYEQQVNVRIAKIV